MKRFTLELNDCWCWSVHDLYNGGIFHSVSDVRFGKNVVKALNEKTIKPTYSDIVKYLAEVRKS